MKLGLPSPEQGVFHALPAHSVEGGAPPVLLQYAQLLRRWKWVMMAIVAAALTLGLIATLLMTPKYTAQARVEISRETKNVTNVQGLESEQANRDIEFYQTQYSLLQARSLATRVARALRLSGRDDFFAAHGVDPAGAARVTGAARSKLSDRADRERLAADILLDNIAIVPVRGSALVDIMYTSASPELSRDIANAWASQFMASSIDRRFASTSDARKFLEGRLADLRTRLEQSERDLVRYATANDIVTIGRTQNSDGRTQSERTLAAATLEALNTELASATAARITVQSRATGSGGKSITAEALRSPTIAQLRQKRAELTSEQAKMLAQFEPGYPPVRALGNQIATLDSAISQEESRIQRSISREFIEAVDRERQLQAKVDDYKSRLSSQQRSSIQYNIYLREADTNRQLYDALLQRYKEIGIAGVSANNIAIVDDAKLPLRPSSPKLLMNLLAALVVGLGLAVLAAFALDQIDEGIRDSNAVSRTFGIPLLVSVPKVKADDVLAELDNARSAIAEAHLTLRSNLAFSTDHGVPRSIMLTSTRPAEGKSTTSVALAAVVGRTGKSVVLIDADMRSPSVDGMLDLPNVYGLSNYLSGQDGLGSLLQESRLRNVKVITTGPVPPSAAELLSSGRMEHLIGSLLEQFDHVIIDSPPILGLADAPMLARAVEGCIFVAEAEGVAVRGIQASLARLRGADAHIIGMVLTKVTPRETTYGYGYGYGYGESENRA